MNKILNLVTTKLLQIRFFFGILSINGLLTKNQVYKRNYNQKNLEAAIQSYKLIVIRKKKRRSKEVESK